jgi:trehalose 6-phosphate phosphatase
MRKLLNRHGDAIYVSALFLNAEHRRARIKPASMPPATVSERYSIMDNPDASAPDRASGRVLLTPPGHALLVDASLFLDFDGTLVDLAPRPDDIIVDTRLKALLSRLAVVLHGRLAIISGRPICQLRQLIGRIPLSLSGSHGAEILWPDGTVSGSTPPDSLDKIAQEMSHLQEVYSGIVIERKPYGVALHYRGAPQAEALCRDLAIALSRLNGLVLQAGKMVFELRAPGADKGSALRLLFNNHAMAGTKPIFIGDDDTDEAAFIAAAELGGAGILVGPERPTAAHFRLEDVAATIEWLETICGKAL